MKPHLEANCTRMAGKGFHSLFFNLEAANFLTGADTVAVLRSVSGGSARNL